MQKQCEGLIVMDAVVNDLIDLFGAPTQWSSGLPEKSLPGKDRPHVFCLNGMSEFAATLFALDSAQIRNVALIGINPTSLSVALSLQQRSFKVSLLPSGRETALVQAALQTEEALSALKRNGITYHPFPATSLQGSQIHCQSGYCGFICEGRFIKESEEVGCVVTESGNVYVDAVIIAGP